MKHAASFQGHLTRGAGDRSIRRPRRHPAGAARLLIALSLCACPQRLDDDFQLGVSAVEPPATAENGSDVGGDAVPDSVTDAAILTDIDTGTNGAPAPTPESPALIVDSIPADGASGVLPDARLVLSFSAPMQRASVEAAYSSSDLPKSDVTFSWSDGDTVLHIQPNAALRSSAGTDATSVEAVGYAFEIAAGASDAAGNALVPRSISFSMARAISQRLSAVTHRDLTGNWRSDSTYGLADCERADTTVCMGDSPATGEPAYRGFMTFDLRQAPASLIAITAAELSCSIALVYGTPFTSLGALHIDHVAFDLIGDAAFSAAAFPERESLTAPMFIGDVLAVDALAAVRSDWAVRDYNQYRLAFATGTDSDGSVDQLGCDWSTVQLALTYWLP
jgi:hypothetical protein